MPKKKFNWTLLNSEPIVYIQEAGLSQGDILNILKQADRAYHNGESIIDDVHYDVIVAFYEELTGEPWEKIGADIVAGKRVKLPIHMGSMTKVKPDTSKLKNWLKKYTGPYVLSDKLDGISIMLHYENNDTTPKIYTRGNGQIGSDASALSKYIKFPKIDTLEPIYIRGELLISKSNWGFYKSEYKNPRNAVSGLIGGLVSAKKIKPKYLKKLDFILFDVTTVEGMKSSDAFVWAKKHGFNVVHHKITKKLTIKGLSDELLDRRGGSDYEIDGIILMDDKVYPRPTSGNPKYALAFKMVLDDQKAETTVTGVEWNVSKHGLLKPVVNLSPIVIAGTTIRRATGYNAKWIVENNIGPGAKVILIKSGDIIPKIIKVTTPSKKPQLPKGEGSKWEWGTGVDIVVIGKSAEVDKVKLLGFMNKLEVEGFKKGTINKVYDAGYTTLPSILAMTVEDFLSIDGIQEKMATKLHTNLHQRYDDASLTLLLGATNALGEGIGTKRLDPLLEAIPDLCNSSLTLSDDDIRERIVSLDGFSVKIADKIISNRVGCVKLLESLPKKKVVKTKKASASSASMDLIGMSFVFTGGRMKDLEEVVVLRGGKIGSSVSKNTTILIAKDPTSKSGKIKKANKLGVQIMNWDQFRAWIDKKSSSKKTKPKLKLKQKSVKKVKKVLVKKKCGINPKTGRCKIGMKDGEEKCEINSKGNCAKKK